jgi:hypothetical protein
MSASKKRKEIDKAIRHLMDYIEQSDEWGPLFKQLIHRLCAPVAAQLEADIDTLIPELINGPYGHMGFGYLFEEMATTTWDNEGVTPIDTFLKTRGWREAPAGRRYLRALNESSLQFFEITAVEPGKWVEVRPFGTDTHSIRVAEHAASQSLHPWGALVARVYLEGKSRRFTGAMLPMNSDAAAYVHEQLESVPADLAQWYQELADEGEDVEGISEDFADDIAHERMTRLAESAFFCFALDVLDPPAPVMPEMVNTHDEKIVMTRFRFPTTTDTSTLTDALLAHPDIVHASENVLSWLASGASKTLLGQIEIRRDTLIFQTNSVERGRTGVHLIESLLGTWVGPAMGVHENLADLVDRLPPDQTLAPDPSLQDNPEVQALLQTHLMEHYRRTLDEPIPMLDNHTPRACAADPEKRQSVVDWLKYLENSTSKTSGSSTDLRWLWTELGLDAYRPKSTTE